MPSAIMVGQGVGVTVSVFAPTFFTTAPAWPDTVDIPNAIGRIAAGRAINLTERVGGQSFAGISHDYRVYPLAAGTITIPPIAVTMSYALEGGRSSPPLTLRSSPLVFRAQSPPGVEPGERVFAAAAFSLADHLSRSTKNLRAGDAVTRTVTMIADDSWSAILPPVSFDRIEGVATYAKSPSTSDEADERGGPNRATRIDSVSYVFERAGAVTLPGMSVRWWDESQQRLRTATLPPIPLSIAAGPAPSSIAFVDDEAVARQRAADARAERHRRERLVVGLAASAAILVVLMMLLWQFGPPIAHRIAAAWQRAARSEPAHFRSVIRASRANDPRATYIACLAWLDRIWMPHEQPMSLERASTLAGDPALVAASRALGAQLFGGTGTSTPWSGAEFARLISEARPVLLRAARGHQDVDGTGLPPLNPPKTDARRASYKRVPTSLDPP